PGEQDVVQGLLTAPRRLDEDPELLGHLGLIDEVLELPGPEGSIEVIVHSIGPGVVDDDLVVDAGGANPLPGLHQRSASSASLPGATRITPPSPPRRCGAPTGRSPRGSRRRPWRGASRPPAACS